MKKFAKKKREKEPENVVVKREKKWEKKKENEGQYEHFYFNDFWVWDWCMFFVILFCENCIVENIVYQFDKSGTLV